jgi:hypothetical protein
MQQSASEKKLRPTFYFLIMAETINICCDTISVTLLYKKLYLARLMIDPLTYVIKLKVEFFVLNRLTRLVKWNRQSTFSTSTATDSAQSGRSVFEGFTETFSPQQTVDEKRTESLGPTMSTESWTTRGVLSSMLTNALTQRPTATPHFITRSPIVEVIEQSSGPSIEALERQYLGRFGFDGQVRGMEKPGNMGISRDEVV